MRELILNYTTVCNSRCETCSLWRQKPPTVLSVGLIAKLLASERLEGLQTVYLTGGEPFLSPLCVDIARCIKTHHPDVRLNGDTNALDPPRYLRHLLQIRDEVGLEVTPGLSLNGPAHIHDKTRGVEGSHDKVLELATLLKVHEFHFAFAFLATRQTTGEGLAYVRKLARGFGTVVGITPFRSGARYNTKDAVTDSYDEFVCPAIRSVVQVWPDGTVRACEEARPELVVGNLHEEDPDEMDWDRVSEYVVKRECQPCSVRCYWTKRMDNIRDVIYE